MTLNAPRTIRIGIARLALALAAAPVAATMLPACVGRLPPPGVQMLQQVDQTYRRGDFYGTVTRANEFLAVYGGVEAAGEAYYLRGLAYANLNDRARAQKDFEAALRSASRSDLGPLAEIALGNLAYEQGSLAEAAGHYLRVVEKLPNEGPKDEVLYRLGKSCAYLGDWPAARQWFAQLLHLFPGSLREAAARRYFAAGGFTVQCGAFRLYANAQQQAADLRRQGLPARQVQDPRMRYHLVQVGLYASHQEARQALAQVARLVPDAAIVP